MAKKYLSILTVIAVGLSSLAPVAFAELELVNSREFMAPDIKQDFCGQHIGRTYCQCAFHGDYCANIGFEDRRDEADRFVRWEYKVHVAEKLQEFKNSCKRTRGGELKRGGAVCEIYREVPEKPDPEEKQCLPDDFDRDWVKYSDFDDAIPINERSHEAKQYDEVLQKIAANMEKQFILKRDMEIDRLTRLELRQYKQALVRNIKVNLLKSFWRLAWVTYDTTVGASVPGKYAQGATGVGRSYAKIFDGAETTVQKIGNTLNVMRSLTPSDSKLALNTKETAGKVSSISLSTGITALQNLGDPAEVGAKLFGEIANLPVPNSANITPEEIALLGEQHQRNKTLDDVLQESYRVNRERRNEVESLEKELESQMEELEEWKQAEHERVKDGILESCE